jgi:DNA-binding transcriptional ArsR family regulator
VARRIGHHDAGWLSIADSIGLLDKKISRRDDGSMFDVAVIDDPAAAEASLDPVRARLLAALAEPGSATSLAEQAGLTRQKANYHLRALERHGLIELVEERRKGNCTERIMRATASSYVISPTALAAVAPDPARSPDQLSARWMLALAARLIREVGYLITGAGAARKGLATFAIDSEIRFASAAERAAFAAELAASVTALVGRYHDEKAPGGRKHRLIIAMHPSITGPTVIVPDAGNDRTTKE